VDTQKFYVVILLLFYIKIIFFENLDYFFDIAHLDRELISIAGIDKTLSAKMLLTVSYNKLYTFLK